MPRRWLDDLADLEAGLTVKFEILPDEEGFIERQCPNIDCRFVFKVLDEQWDALPDGVGAYCPMCRHEAPGGQDWTTDEQGASARKQAEEYMTARVTNSVRRAMGQMASQFNRSSRGPLRLTMSVSGPRPRQVELPTNVPGTDAWEQRHCCDACESTWAVVGTGYFCPACGHSCAVDMARKTLGLVEIKLSSCEAVRRHLIDAGQRDQAEVLARDMIETALVDCVVGFQKAAAALYARLPEPRAAAKMNVFQRIDEGSALWSAATGEGYDAWLDGDVLLRLQLHFQRRHLLSHTAGVVDRRYLDRSGDTSYRLGQRIAVTPAHVRELAEAVTRLIEAMETHAGGGGSGEQRD